MKLVITGASSFIGKQLVQRAAEHGDEILLVMRSGHENESLPTGARRLNLEFQDYVQLGDLTGPCDCFIHLAWNGTRGAQRMDITRQQENLKFSLAGLRSMLSAGCKRIVTAGSQAEYGPHTEKITEESQCRPNTEYGKAKLAFYQETATLCRSAGAEYREPRFFSLYGPHDYEGTMIISILRDMLAGRPCKLTQGVQNWDFLYLRDAIDALYLLCSQLCPNGVYNFGSGDVRQLKDYILEMAQLTGTNSELCFGAVPYPPTGMVSLWPDISKLRRELHWQSRTKFAEGIQRILTSLKETETS